MFELWIMSMLDFTSENSRAGHAVMCRKCSKI
jgi:hypothetical protein